MTVTFNLSMPAELLKLVDKQAKSELRTRSDFFRELARAYLIREREWKTAQRVLSAQAKKMGIRTEADVDRVIQEFRKEQRAATRKN